MFSDAFCSLMDDMLSGNMQPKQTVEEESLFYKIEYRLNRLYEVMQENKNSIAQERADLQELISDISHQVKTPIANLKISSCKSFLWKRKASRFMTRLPPHWEISF